MNTDWYGRQLVRRPVYDYDAAKGPAIYRDQQWKKPATGPLHMTLTDVDGVAEYYELRAPMEFAAHDLHATIDPRNLEYGGLMRADALVSVRCGSVILTEGRMGRVGDRVAIRVTKQLRKPNTTFAMFEKADEQTKLMEAQ